MLTVIVENQVTPIEFSGIVASSLTAIVFAVVLAFQVKATRAAVAAAKAAENAAKSTEVQAKAAMLQAEILRPHVIFEAVQPYKFSADKWAITTPIKNVGSVPAYNLTMHLNVIDANGASLGRFGSAVPSDLAPTDRIATKIDQDDKSLGEELSKGADNIRLVVSAQYSLDPERLSIRKSVIIFSITYIDGQGSFSSSGSTLDRVATVTDDHTHRF